MKKNPNDLSFFDHLEELRRRLIQILLAVGLAAGCFYRFSEQAIDFLTAPVGAVVFTAPSDAFMARIHLSLIGGVILGFPFILYHAWRFVSAALTNQEKKYIFLFAPFSLALFLAGVTFAYFVMIPVSMKFFLSFSSETVVPMITIKSYIGFVGTMLLAFGVVFELPLVLMFLTRMGIATPAFLVQKRRHAAVLILIVSAVLTPPDVISQLLMAAPLAVLYELGILAAKLTYRPR